MIRRLIVGLQGIMLLGASDIVDPKEQISREIEHRVVLPNGAEPITEYGRNYAFVDDRRVQAVYLIPPKFRDYRAGCAIMTEEGPPRPCTELEILEMSKMDQDYLKSMAAADQSKWFGNIDELPFISDGGCEQITIEYDLLLRRFLLVACNGSTD